MTNYQGAPLEEQVKKLLEQNLAYAKQIYVISKKIKRYILWGRIMSLIYLIIIVVPIILGVVFLPSFIKGYLKTLPFGIGQQAGMENLLGDDVDKDSIIKAIGEQGGPINFYKNILDLYNQ